MKITFPPVSVRSYLALLRAIMTSSFDLQQAQLDGLVSPEVTLPADITHRLTEIFLEVYIQLDVAILHGETELEFVLEAEPEELPVLVAAFSSLAHYKELLASVDVVSDVDWDSFRVVNELVASIQGAMAEN